MRRKRQTCPESDDDEGVIAYTDEYDLDILHTHAPNHARKAASSSRQQATQRRRIQARALSHAAARVLSPTDAAAAAQQQAHITSPAETAGAQRQGPGSLLSSPASAGARPHSSQDRYQEYVASLRIDLDKSCVVVATDGNEAKCIAVAAYQDDSSSIGILVGQHRLCKGFQVCADSKQPSSCVPCRAIN